MKDKFNPSQATMFPIPSFSKQVVASNPDQQPQPKTKTAEEGIIRSDENADVHWKECYDKCLKIVCEEKEFFTADDIAICMNVKFPDVNTHSKRAAGARMISAAKNCWCERTDRFQLSRIEGQHNQPKVIWHSLLFHS